MASMSISKIRHFLNQAPVGSPRLASRSEYEKGWQRASKAAIKLHLQSYLLRAWSRLG
jgi:hypothetical protein